MGNGIVLIVDGFGGEGRKHAIELLANTHGLQVMVVSDIGSARNALSQPNHGIRKVVFVDFAPLWQPRGNLLDSVQGWAKVNFDRAIAAGLSEELLRQRLLPHLR